MPSDDKERWRKVGQHLDVRMLRVQTHPRGSMMPKRKSRHRVTVRKRNLHGSRAWWVTCTCGDFMGYDHKLDAQQYGNEHAKGAR